MSFSCLLVAATADLVLEPLERAGEIALLLELPPALVAQLAEPLQRRLGVRNRVVNDDALKRLKPAPALVRTAAVGDLGLELLASAGKVALLVELLPGAVAEGVQIFEGRIRILQRVADRHAIGSHLPARRSGHGFSPFADASG
jgi:hypothetical protein